MRIYNYLLGKVNGKSQLFTHTKMQKLENYHRCNDFFDWWTSFMCCLSTTVNWPAIYCVSVSTPVNRTLKIWEVVLYKNSNSSNSWSFQILYQKFETFCEKRSPSIDKELWTQAYTDKILNEMSHLTALYR